ncbi:uncharacterized protein LOC127248717 [Andrographis paniculata]|uniref:uncharacterized protein LOC127248717 n=1 Tax=Andrographis paniculata TaxID=175694 RepID=UPI0021E81A43|nr:uncharacterized protein LOC127248717 [Andrographis paniculata]
MAVIQEESPGENGSKSRPDSATGYGSEGYETASDTELNDDDASDSNHPSRNHDNRDGASTSENGDAEVSRGEKEKKMVEKADAAGDAEDNEKALERANDAKLEGNSLFKDGQYEEALSKYEFAVQIAPDGPSSTDLRSICHANRAACYSKLGKYEETIKECTKALELNPSYMKAIVRRGEAREKLEQYEEAIADMNKILELDPLNDQAKRTIIRLKPLAEEKREKMKEEMIGKLKDMGNSILGRFGMSVDNFKAVKDPNTGSYSISFQK